MKTQSSNLHAGPILPSVDFIEAAIAPMRDFDIDDALLRYCMDDLLLAQQFDLLALFSSINASDPAPQSFSIANMPEALRI